jgi:hypothetical protein
MSSSPDTAAEHTTPVSNLTYLHKQQRKGNKVLDTPQARGRNTQKNELGRRNRGTEKVTRIYPREMYVQRLYRSFLLCAMSGSWHIVKAAGTIRDSRLPSTKADCSATEQSLRPLRSACRPRLHPRITMRLRLHYYPLSVPLELVPRNTPTSGPSRFPFFRTRAHQAPVA